jgi:hypothetical protein
VHPVITMSFISDQTQKNTQSNVTSQSVLSSLPAKYPYTVP